MPNEWPAALFTYGLLHAREQRIADETRSEAAKLAKKGR